MAEVCEYCHNTHPSVQVYGVVDVIMKRLCDKCIGAILMELQQLIISMDNSEVSFDGALERLRGIVDG